MDTIETKNARIDSTFLGIEDHGIMTFVLGLDYGDSGHQGAGTYALDEWDEVNSKRRGMSKSIELIRKILEIVSVEKWEDLEGKFIRVKAEHCKVHAIGNITKNEWLDFKRFWDED